MAMWQEQKAERKRKQKEAAARRAWGRKHWGSYHWGQCAVCWQRFEHSRGGRRRIYCSNACRQRAYRERLAAGAEADHRRVVGLGAYIPPADPSALRRFIGWLRGEF